MKPIAGYQEIEHTADWALKVWAPTLAELLIQAAKGMLALAGIRFDTSSRRQRSFILNYQDHESLLVNFLSEIVYYLERDNIAFNRFRLQFEANRLHVIAYGHPVQAIEKLIKAVTYHQLEIRQTDEGYLAQIVFDV